MSEVAQVTVWTSALAAPMLQVPDGADDKYSRGVLGVRTGSASYPGAAVLGVEAAWRTGLGMVRYVGPSAVGARVLDARPETVLGAGRVQAWLVGSGTDAAARSASETAALCELLRGTVPVVVDAGALDLVAQAGGPGGAPLILTPHDREFARLEVSAGLAGPRTTAASRTTATRALARALGHVVLRKGATTIIATPDGACTIVAAATPWLATAGTGDVLGGVLGALIAGAAASRATASRATATAAAESDAEAGAAPAEAHSVLSLGELRALAATSALLHGVAARIAAGLPPLAPTGTESDAAQGRPITALDVAHALPWAVASIRRSVATGGDAAARR